MRWTPHATVACVVEKDGRFLLVEERSNGQTVLNQPAGHLEPGERIIDGARREALEETGWEVDIEALLGFYTFTSSHNHTCYHRFCFAAKPAQHRPELELDACILDTHWLTLEEIREKADCLRSPMVLQGIEDYLSGTRYPLELLVELD